MSLENLKCKECGATYDLDAHYFCENCFGPLEVAYDHSALDPAEAKRRIQAGSQGIWRYADFLPFEGRPGDPLEPGLTPLLRADRLAERLGLEAEIWIKNDAANPTHSFKDRVVAVAVAKAQELGFDTVACASTGNLANAVAAHAAAAGLESYVFVPANLEEQKLLATGVYGTNLVGVRGNYDDVNRLCTQLAETRPVGLRQRQPAPLLRRGLEDARLRDGRAARLGAARPGRLPDRLGLALHQGRPRLPGVARHRPRQGEQPVFNGAQAEGCSPSPPPSPKAGTSASRSSPETIAKSLAIGDPADGPYAVEHARRTGGAHRLGHRRGDPRRDPPARRDDRDLHRDRRRRHRRRAARSSPSAARSPPASASSSTSPARA